MDLGLFKFLRKAPNSNPKEISESLSLHIPYVEVWCKTAFAARILETDNCVEYRLAEHFDKILADEKDPSFLGGYIKLGTDFAAKDFEFSTTAFRDGSTVPFQNRSNHFADTVGSAISGLHVLTTHKLLPSLPGMKQKLKTDCNILDIGCGTGRLVFRLAKAWPKSSIVGVDIDNTGINIAREKLNELQLESQVRIVQGDVIESGEQSSFDAILMVEVLHEISPEVRQETIGDIFKLLKPEGWLLIVDETYPSETEDYRKAEYQFPIQTAFEEVTWGNIIPTKNIQENLLLTAGFTKKIGRKIIGEGFTILEVQK